MTQLKNITQQEIDLRINQFSFSTHVKEFLKGCLKINPFKRKNVYELLRSKYIQSDFFKTLK